MNTKNHKYLQGILATGPFRTPPPKGSLLMAISCLAMGFDHIQSSRWLSSLQWNRNQGQPRQWLVTLRKGIKLQMLILEEIKILSIHHH